MRPEHCVRSTLFAVAAGLAALAVAPLAAQAPSAAAKASAGRYTVPKTPDGQPDIRGVWANDAATPIERPAVLSGRSALTDGELASLQRRAAELFAGDGDAAFLDSLYTAALSEAKTFTSNDGGTGNYNQFWLANRWFDHRTSLVVDPPDGKIPSYTPEAARRQAERTARRSTSPADGPEDRSQFERCLNSPDWPNLLAGYNSNYQILQLPGYVVIIQELIHDVRIIPLDGRPHLDKKITRILGDSRGHWEGDTLVVDTTNFSPLSNLRGASENLHLVERFTRVAADTLQYEFTATDPSTWTRPWTARLLLKASRDRLFEYACHEGNLGLPGILSGHRAQEQTVSSR
jgi:hypothetical protein